MPKTLLNLRNVTKVVHGKNEVRVCYTSNPMFGMFILGSGSLDTANCDIFKWDTAEEAESHFDAIQKHLHRREQPLHS